MIRDLVLLGVGSFGILYQQLNGQVNVPLLALYTAMVGIPGAARVVQLALRPELTDPSSSQSQQPSQPGASGS